MNGERAGGMANLTAAECRELARVSAEFEEALKKGRA